MRLKLAAAVVVMTGPGALAAAQDAPEGRHLLEQPEVTGPPAGPDAPADPRTAQEEAAPGPSVPRSGAQAEAPALIDASRPKVVAELIRATGLPAELNVQDSGAVEIRSQANGANFWLYFQACDPDFTSCEVITFAAGFDFASPQVPDLLGNWNATRYSKAYLDKDGDPFVEFSVNMVHGVSARNFLNTLDWFTLEMKAFMDQISWDDSDVAAAQPI